VTLRDGEAVPSNGSAGETDRRSEKKIYDTTVLFGNTGHGQHGATARMVFADGTIVDRELPAAASWVRFRVRYESRLAWAAVDPDRKNVWDWNHQNDSKVLRSGKGAAKNLSRRAAVKYQGWAAYLVCLFTQLLWALA
jgi:hypothetical protein